MRTAASRLHKGFSFERRLAACESAFEREGARWAGSWRFWAPSAGAASGERAQLASAGEALGEADGEHAQLAGEAAGCEGAQLAGAAPVFSGRAARAIRDVDVLSSGPVATSPERTKREEPYDKVVLDLGCGKGEYTVACAKLRPEMLFVGIDVDPVCVLRGAEEAVREGVPNAVFIHDPNPDLAVYFGPGELSAILMNFPTPFPKKKKAPLRLTYADRLMAYRALLAPGAPVRLRTDSQPFRDFSLTQLEIAGYELQWSSDEVRKLYPDEPESAYERKLVAKGAPVLGFSAVCGAAPARVEQTAPLSLISYLPADLDELTYVPHGMQGTVENMRARNANRRAKGEGDWRPPAV